MLALELWHKAILRGADSGTADPQPLAWPEVGGRQ